MFRFLLEEEGYQVSTLSFAPQDVFEVERIHPDLVILDLVFGVESAGWQLLQKMRMYPPTAEIPIIVCTAATQQVREIEGQLSAHNAVLIAKPFDIDELIRAVKLRLATVQHPDPADPADPADPGSSLPKKEELEGEALESEALAPERAKPTQEN